MDKFPIGDGGCGSYRVQVSITMRFILSLCFSGVVFSQTPTLVQYAPDSNTGTTAAGVWARPAANSKNSGSDYMMPLPDGAQAGNTILGCFTYNSGSGVGTVTISDDKSDTYSIIATATDSTNTVIVKAFRALNVTAGARQIKATFATGTSDRMSMEVAEFYNVAASTADDGNSTGTSASGLSTMSTGSITPGTSGDLLYQCGIRSQTPAVISFTAGASWTLLSTDIIDGLVQQYRVYGSTSPVTPSLTMASNSGYAAVAIALKAATQGSPRPAGMRIAGIEHYNVYTSLYSNTTPITVQIHPIGNLLTIMSGGGDDATTGHLPSNWITSITDSAGNTWARAGARVQIVADPANASIRSEVWYASNLVPNTDLFITVNTVASGVGDSTFMVYDVVGAATNPYTGTVKGSGTQSVSGSLTSWTVNPGNTNGLVISMLPVSYNTINGASSPAGSISDAGFYTGEDISGPCPLDQNNGWTHFYNSNSGTASQTWTILQAGLAIQNWVGQSVGFASPSGNLGSTRGGPVSIGGPVIQN